MNTPILFLVFNRPKLTRKVFERIREVRPAKLYIGADGPRSHVKDEKIACEAVRSIAQDVDWECEVVTLFRDKNLGCGVAVNEAISWFFDHEEEGIILEDDVLPDLSFFSFCEEMLEKYRDVEEIAMIGGYNATSLIANSRYYFSAYNSIWGWATWKRVWKNYQFNLQSKQWIQIKKNLKGTYTFSDSEVYYWRYIFDRMLEAEIDTWDYQLTFSIWVSNKYCITSANRLTENIGFDEATHSDKESPLRHLKVQEDFIDLPVPTSLNRTFDKQVSSIVFNIPNSSFLSLWQFRLKPYIKRILGTLKGQKYS